MVFLIGKLIAKHFSRFHIAKIPSIENMVNLNKIH